MNLSKEHGQTLKQSDSYIISRELINLVKSIKNWFVHTRVDSQVINQGGQIFSGSQNH